MRGWRPDYSPRALRLTNLDLFDVFDFTTMQPVFSIEGTREGEEMMKTCRRGARYRGARISFTAFMLGLALTASSAQGKVGKDVDCVRFDHAHIVWNSILEQYTRDGWVDYARLKAAGQESLNLYLGSLESVCSEHYVSWSRDERLAFWINVYNAYTIKLIIDHYPVRSIRSIGWLPLAAFRKSFIPLRWYHSKDLSLNDIENGILRATFEEPRIHFAIVCASRSCPSLRSEAFRPADLERQLEESARAFIRDPTKNRFDPVAGTLYLSKIFDWFKGDFEAATGGLKDYVARHLEEPAASRVATGDPVIRFLSYDWSLNGE
jgi:hypothetical protein